MLKLKYILEDNFQTIFNVRKYKLILLLRYQLLTYDKKVYILQTKLHKSVTSKRMKQYDKLFLYARIVTRVCYLFASILF